ncbi:MAG TPA: carbon-nitrogen hydrolase family protein [Acidimicrobiales bacterium]|nr:carbon-nitrogen hydrolase family protein [Acidimicrobiales bacterium]
MTLRVALAQCEVSEALPSAAVLRVAGERVRAAMAAAAEAGARVVFLPEGTLTYPHKTLLTDWSTQVAWSVLDEELREISRCAGELGVWTVVGAPHRLSDGRRPHNSLYVLSDEGTLVTRYDKRRLSTTEVTQLYTPGTEPGVVEVDGFRIGVVLCLETLFPELFVSYALDGCDLVVVASAPDAGFHRMCAGHAAMNAMNVGLCVAASDADGSRSGVWSMFGSVARADTSGPALVVADIDHALTGPGRDFHRLARTGELYAGRHAPDDPRSRDRQSF